MAQLDRRGGNTPRTPTSPTIEQLLRGEASRWSPRASPTVLSHHDVEEDHGHHPKKSVLAKVKERARKWRHSLSKKKHGDEDNTTPSWGVSLDDDEDGEDDEGDPEYLGAPMYESELASDVYKETARQHPRADPVIPEKHVLSNTVNPGTESNVKYSSPFKETPETVTNEKQFDIPNKTIPEIVTNDKPSSPNKTIAETLSEKLAPAYATISGATHAITNKIQGLTVSASPTAPKPMLTASASAPAAPVTSMPATTEHLSSTGEQIWDKGVSMKEYIMHKLEPGEDERALSQVISEAMSPRKTPGSPGVVDMVKEAVSSLLRNEESPQSKSVQSGTANSSTNIPNPATTNSFQNIPISINAHHQVVEEENHGRILQTN